MKKWAIGCILFSFFCLALSPVPSHAGEKAVKLEFSSFLPPQNPLSLMLAEYSKDVEKRTNGQVKVTYHPGQTLTPAPQTYDSVIREIADMGFASLDITVGRFPFMEVLNLPFGVKNAYLMTQLSNGLYNKFKPKELDEVKLMFLLTHGPGIVHTKKAVRKIEDLQGQKLRCPGGSIVNMIKALGGVPLVMPTPETYDALRKGVADGVVATPDALEAFKFGEILPYTTENYRTAYESTGYVIMNKGKWNSLPPDVQKTMESMSGEYAEKLAKLWDQMDQTAIKNYAASKRTIIHLSPEEEERWYQRILPLYDAYVKEKSAKGLPAAEALKFCRDWAKANQ